VKTDASTSEKVAAVNNPSASNAPEHEALVRIIGKKINDLSGCNNVEVNASLVALSVYLKTDPTIHDSIVAAEGRRGLQLLNNWLKKRLTFSFITRLTSHHKRKFGIIAIGGVGAGVKVMQIFPKWQASQGRACSALLDLIWRNIGTKKAIEAGGLEVLLAAINNHLGSCIICVDACVALFNMIAELKKTPNNFFSLGGGAAVFKVREPSSLILMQSTTECCNLLLHG
jgi:hypothetical protein